MCESTGNVGAAKAKKKRRQFKSVYVDADQNAATQDATVAASVTEQPSEQPVPAQQDEPTAQPEIPEVNSLERCICVTKHDNIVGFNRNRQRSLLQ